MGGFGGKDSLSIQQITLNMINTLLDGNTIFTEPNDCLSLTERASEVSVKVYPNPSQGNFLFTSNVAFSRGAFLTIYNNLGVIKLQKSVGNQFGTRIDISAFPGGIYFYRITDWNKGSIDGKIMKIE